MTLEQFKQDPAAIDRVEILSLEGQRYLVRLSGGDETWLLSDARGQSLLFRGARQARDLLAPYLAPSLALELVHHSAHGEMVGLEEEPFEPLRLALRSPR